MTRQHSAVTQLPQQGLQDPEKRGVFFKEYRVLLR